MSTTPEPGAPGTAPGRWVERWWAGELGWRGRLLDLALLPAEHIYRGVVRLRGTAYDTGVLPSHRVSVPVISVGNISVGGAGKTPVSRWLVAELLRRGERPAVLHGGYAADEPELHRRWYPDLPIMVGRDRVREASGAIERGATVLVLDDGFQHRRLTRDLDLVLIAAEGWSHRPRLLPRGPWRESVSALERASVVAITRKVATAERAAALRQELRRHAPRSLLVQFWLRPAGWLRWGAGETRPLRPGAGGPEGEVVAVAAIARPELFVENARSAGAGVAATLFFPDHHDYLAEDLDEIREYAAGRALVTTAKDAVKLSALDPTLDLWVLEQEVVLESGGTELSDLLDHALSGSGGPRP